jgi:predicted nucleic acid-binding protein
VSALVDTNVLVYRFDPRQPEKQRRATELLRGGIEGESLLLSHQAIVEFVAAVTRPLSGGPPLLTWPEAVRETEELCGQFTVLLPDEIVLRTALRGVAAYQLAWFDAHVWAYAERYGIPDLLSEDFQHGRRYGGVRAVNPFVAR